MDLVHPQVALHSGEPCLACRRARAAASAWRTMGAAAIGRFAVAVSCESGGAIPPLHISRASVDTFLRGGVAHGQRCDTILSLLVRAVSLRRRSYAVRILARSHA